MHHPPSDWYGGVSGTVARLPLLTFAWSRGQTHLDGDADQQ
jgi:hypothetical protein